MLLSLVVVERRLSVSGAGNGSCAGPQGTARMLTYFVCSLINFSNLRKMLTFLHSATNLSGWTSGLKTSADVLIQFYCLYKRSSVSPSYTLNLHIQHSECVWCVRVCACVPVSASSKEAHYFASRLILLLSQERASAGTNIS